MKYQIEIRATAGFLEAARTALDHAELTIVGASDNERAAPQLLRAMALLNVCVRNVNFCATELHAIAERIAREQKNGEGTQRTASGQPLVSESETKRDPSPGSTGSAS
jgi:hypothetical protein